MNPSTLTIDGVEISVTRKDVRRINLRIDKASGVASASIPREAPMDEVTAWLRGQIDWIRGAQASWTARSVARGSVQGSGRAQDTSSRLVRVAGVEVLLVFKRVSHSRLYIDSNDRIVLTVPFGGSAETALAWAGTQGTWLEGAKGRVARRARIAGSEGTVTLWGEEVPLIITYGGTTSGARVTSGMVRVRVPKGSGADEVGSALASLWQSLVKREGSVLLRAHAKSMGVTFSSLRVSPTSSRWGSCQVHTKAIQLSSRVVHYPKAGLEYVVVHELAHLRVPNHSSAFYDVVAKELPTWRTAKSVFRGDGDDID
jgi:predicted metal-dependent hydrolase